MQGRVPRFLGSPALVVVPAGGANQHLMLMFLSLSLLPPSHFL